MNKRQRVSRILAGKAADRPPVCFWRHFGPLPPQETVRAHIRFFEETDMDLMKMMCDEFFTYPLEEKPTPASLLRLHPLGSKHPYIRGQVERATQINEALRGEAFSLYNAFSPYATMKHTLGDGESMALLRQAPEAALHLMEVICEDTCALIEGILRESGTDGMMLPLQDAEEGRFTREEYLAWIAPTEERVIACADSLSANNLLHLCGWEGVPNRLDWWSHYPARMVNWAVYVENLDLAQGRRRFPGRVLLGGFDNRPGMLLHAGCQADIQAETARLVREAGPQALILGADCSVPEDLEPRRIRWIVQALEELSSQPDESIQESENSTAAP